MSDEETRIENVTSYKIRLEVLRREKKSMELIELNPGDGFVFDRRIFRKIHIGLWDEEIDKVRAGRSVRR